MKALMNMTYQEVPAGNMSDEEVKTEEQARCRKTQQLPLVTYDESLFLDKIKEFNPASM